MAAKAPLPETVSTYPAANSDSANSVDFGRIFKQLPLPHMILDHELRYVEANDAYCRLLQRDRRELIGRPIFECFPETPEREAAVRRALEAGLRGEEAWLDRIAFRVQEADGSWREGIWEAHHMPVYDHAGRIVGVTQKTVDVSAQVALERMRDTIVRELNHRVKNMFAKVVAIARRTGTDHEDVGDFIERFSQRLHGMARAHDVLVNGPGDRLSIGALVRGELSAFAELDDSRVALDGPEIALTPRAGQGLGMALHELATNAAKYGALGQDEGRLIVRWWTEGEGAALDWIETGVSLDGAPVARGFGSTMIDRIAPVEMAATVDRVFTADGVQCAIRLRKDALAD